MRIVLRNLMGVGVGAVLAMLLIFTSQIISGRVYDWPNDVEKLDVNELASYMRSMPIGTFGLVLSVWAVGTFAGAWLTTSLAGRSPMGHPLAVAVLFLLTGIANLLILPHPVWVWLAALAIFPICGYLGARVALRRGAQPAAMPEPPASPAS